MEQTLPFQRWVGQVVYREVIPRHGPYKYKVLGMRRGVIKDIFPYIPTTGRASRETLHAVLYDVDVSWQTGKISKPKLPENFDFRGHNGHDYSPIVERPFDYGIHTLFELDILIRGGLLGSDGPTWDEPQPKELERLLPFYQMVMDNPDAEYIANPEIVL